MHSKYLLGLAGLAFIASPAAAQQPAGKSNSRGQEPTYCFQYAQDTGSRISRLECKTKKEWARLGVDVDELLNK